MALRFSGILIVISVICSFFTSSTAELTKAAISGGERAVGIALSLCALMGLWCGIMKVAELVGFSGILSRLFRPVLKLVFPEAYKRNMGINEVSASITANLLGVGNGATPLAINAMNALPRGKDGSASDDQVTFIALSCACPCIFPTTVVSLRAAAGSSSPSSILPQVWICSIILATVSVIICRLLSVKRS